MNLEKIDTSYWLIKDKDWMEQRKAQWLAIEKVVGLNRKKTEVNVIKQYFLKGKMPSWDKYAGWDDICRHLDLMLFLFLHPSDSLDVLKPLYQTYMTSELTHPKDIILGYGSLVDHEFISATSPYPSLEEYPFLYLGKKNIILFRIMFENIGFIKEIMFNKADRNLDLEEQAITMDTHLKKKGASTVRTFPDGFGCCLNIQLLAFA